MRLCNVNLMGTGGPQHIQVVAEKIKTVTADSRELSWQPRELTIELDHGLAFPGLINSHDHLDFNLFPQTGNGIYPNYTRWGHDIHQHNQESIREVQKIPQAMRIRWGLYKNLLNGVTTVVNHGPRLEISDPFITVLQNHHCLHSVHFEKHWKLKLNNPFSKQQPYVIHTGEGTDSLADKEIDELIRWNVLKKTLIAVHGVAMKPNQARAFKALVWCPASNYFLLNATADTLRLKKSTSILFGTDSALTAGWNLWEHLRMAKKTNGLTDPELFETLTSNPSIVWEQPLVGSLSAGKDADIVIAKPTGVPGWEGFYSLNPEDIRMVVQKGMVRLLDEEILNQFSENEFSLDQFSKISISGKVKYVYGDVPSLVAGVRQYDPHVHFPISL
jgi:cytosine/adenosine deaminase-related metal-dependent hydrolase